MQKQLQYRSDLGFTNTDKDKTKWRKTNKDELPGEGRVQKKPSADKNFQL